jgi:hypothetical protein
VLVDDDGFAFCYPRTTWKLSKVGSGGDFRYKQYITHESNLEKIGQQQTSWGKKVWKPVSDSGIYTKLPI